MIRYFCGITAECTDEKAQRFNPTLESIGIKMVFMHSESCLSTTLEKSVEDIELAEERHPAGNNLPLQPNCFYSYMPLTGEPNPARHPVIKLLEQAPKRKRANPIVVFINCPLNQERDYQDLPFNVSKDVIFKDELSGKEVGWYNQKTNIIWASDLFHNLENTATRLPKMVNAIREYNTYGRVQEVLTVGADPEFEIISSDDGFVEASSLFGEMNAEIGYDGHSATGEFRPQPHRSPLGLTRNIKRLVRKLNSMQCMSGSKVWVGGGINVTTGGHIHFGLKGMNEEAKSMLYDLVAEPVLAFQSAVRKKNEVSNWGKGSSGNLRDQPHGCEWRPLPSFIVNEEITAAILCTSYAIVKSWKFYNYTRKTGPVTVGDFAQIPLYGAYKAQIDTFIKYFITKEAKVIFNKKNIFKEWNVESFHKITTVDIITPASWLSDYFTSLNVDLPNPVKIEIIFSGDIISTYGIATDYLPDLIRFGEKHYLPPTLRNEGTLSTKAKYAICLPALWYHMTGTTQFCEDFKSVLKNLIIKLGGK
jgi:hypothetical protein